jgi:hypothetical protein
MRSSFSVIPHAVMALQQTTVDVLHGFSCSSPCCVCICDDTCALAARCMSALEFSQPLVLRPIVSDNTHTADNDPIERRNLITED